MKEKIRKLFSFLGIAAVLGAVLAGVISLLGNYFDVDLGGGYIAAFAGFLVGLMSVPIARKMGVFNEH